MGPTKGGALSKNAQKYIPEPPGFTPTEEEKYLLSMYETVKSYEKEAHRLRENAARAKLAAADERYKRELEQKAEEGDDDPASDGSVAVAAARAPKPKKKKSKKVRAEERDITADGAPHSDSSQGSDSEASEDSYERHHAERSRDDRKKDLAERAAEEEERKRMELLGEGRDQDGWDDEEGPSIARRTKLKSDAKGSLVKSLAEASTPPHDFSKALRMSKVTGSVLFPESGAGGPSAVWTPPDSASDPNDRALVIELPKFQSSKAMRGQGNNTLAIKFAAPSESERFSINIAGPGHRDFFDVLFHFNPRQRHKGGQLVVNERQDGIWGQGVAVPLSTLPLIFGQSSCTLTVQVNGGGFDVFIDEKHCARLEHRTQLPTEECNLFLQFPSTDDYGKSENWKVFKVWWGHKDCMAADDLGGVAGVNVYSSLHPKKLFISGLSKIQTEPQVELRRAELERAFRKYGGDLGAIVTVPTNTTFAFVEVENERMADVALNEMSNKYRLNRARRSKHEALQEEREAAEKAKGKRKDDAKGWD